MTRWIAGAALVLVASIAAAEDVPESPALVAAKALAGNGDHAKTAAQCGDAIAAAQRAGDLAAEEKAVIAFETYLDHAHDDKTARSGGTGIERRRALFVIVLLELDPKRNGAFVSAPCLARNLVYLATETSNFTGVKEAAAVLAANAGDKDDGAAAATLAKYAAGLVSVAAVDLKNAVPPLEAALEEAVAAGWDELAVHICAELATTWMRLGAPDMAQTVVDSTATRLGTDCSLSAARVWLYIVKNQFPRPHTEIEAEIDALMRKIIRALGPQGRNRGSEPYPRFGTRGTKGPLSDIGQFLPGLPKEKPFAWAIRKPEGFELHWATEPALSPLVTAPDALCRPSADGVTLAFEGRAAAIYSVCLEAGQGGFGGRHTLRELRAAYLLAEGETFSVTKDGVVTISR